MRPTISFEVDGLGKYEMLTTPNMRELADIETELILFFGEENYYSLIEKINQLQEYSREKNKEHLTPEGYTEILNQYSELLKSFNENRTNETVLKDIQVKLKELEDRFYYDGKIGILNSLQARVNQAQELAASKVLMVSPKGFNIYSLSEEEYKKFRDAQEASLRKFRFEEEERRASQVNKPNSEGTNK